MPMKTKILIFGAGAIGRGFLANKFSSEKYELSFVDKNQNLIKKLNNKKFFYTALIKKNKYILKKIFLKKAFHISEEIKINTYDVVFCCVGPNQCYEIASKFKNAKLVLSCENDKSTVEGIKNLSNNKNVFFAIPDVITSNTASPNLLNKDDLMIITENGELILERNKKVSFLKEAKKVSQRSFKMHWYAKFFIHNAPHALLAYLGWLKNYKYIHEAMKNKNISKIVKGSMREISSALIKTKMVDKKFVLMYMRKELNRFSNKLLFDPISRVAREPIRKLSAGNRIVLSLRLALFNSLPPINTALGVKAALQYFDKNDDQSIYLKNLRSSLSENEILQKISGIELDDPLNSFCTSRCLNKIL
jgi:mannitol-1-phosphate/altronate dehydrogenase